MKNTFISVFKNLTDPRIERKKLYPLEEILLVAFATILGGGDSYTDMRDFGTAKLKTLRKIFPFKQGIPSDDTFGRMFSIINPKEFQRCFITWVETLKSNESEIIAIDGKTIRGSASPINKTKPLHLINAWAAKNRLILGCEKTDVKSNEITAIPKLLSMLSLENTTVTLDAMGCQANIGQQIVEQKGDFVIALKRNHKNLYEDVKTFFELEPDNEAIKKFETGFEKEHGRIERRKYGLCLRVDWLKKMHPNWHMVKSIGFVTGKRIIDSSATEETRYYISTLKDEKKFAQAVRMHWGVENSLHWVLDVVFHEDENRVRSKNAAENLTILRRAAINLVSIDKANKASKRRKRLRAGWDNDYLKKALTQQF